MSKIYCHKCKKYRENKNPTVSSTSNARIFFSDNYAVCKSRTNKFIKKYEAKSLLSMTGEISLLRDLLI